MLLVSGMNGVRVRQGQRQRLGYVFHTLELIAQFRGHVHDAYLEMIPREGACTLRGTATTAGGASITYGSSFWVSR